MVRRRAVVVALLAEVSFVLSMVFGTVAGLGPGSAFDPEHGNLGTETLTQSTGGADNPFLMEGKMAHAGKLNHFDYNVGPIVNLEKAGLADPGGLGPLELDYVFTVLNSELEKEISLDGDVKENYFFDEPGRGLDIIDQVESNVKEEFCGAYYFIDVDPQQKVSYYVSFEGTIDPHDPEHSSVIACAVDAGADSIITLTGIESPVEDLVNEVKGELNTIVKPIAWKVFGPLLSEANTKKKECINIFENELETPPDEPIGNENGMTPEDLCQVPEVALGLIYYGLFDPPERVAFKYWQGDDKEAPSFCPGNGGHTCSAVPENATPAMRGIHPLEDITLYYQAQQFIEANESVENQSMRDLCNEPGPYQDCVEPWRRNMAFSPTGNPGVWKALPGATMSAILELQNAPESVGPVHFTYNVNGSSSTTIDGSEKYTADGRGVPNFDNNDGVTGDTLTTVVDTGADADYVNIDSVFKQFVAPFTGDCGGDVCQHNPMDSELDMNDTLVMETFVQGTIYHEAEGEETSEIMNSSSFKLSQWPIKLDTSDYTIVGDAFRTTGKQLYVPFYVRPKGDSDSLEIDLTGDDIGDGEFEFQAYLDKAGILSKDKSTTLNLAGWSFDPSDGSSSKNKVWGLLIWKGAGNGPSPTTFDIRLGMAPEISVTAIIESGREI